MPEFLDMDGRYALLPGGGTVPITNFIDADGDDCDPADAVVIVCGDDQHGWFTIDLDDTIDAVLH